MVGHGGSSAGSYLADPTSPIPSHCASIVATSTVRVNLEHCFMGGYGTWGCCMPFEEIAWSVFLRYVTMKWISHLPGGQQIKSFYCDQGLSIQISWLLWYSYSHVNTTTAREQKCPNAQSKWHIQISSFIWSLTFMIVCYNKLVVLDGSLNVHNPLHCTIYQRKSDLPCS